MSDDAPYGYCDLSGCNRPLVVPTAVAGGPYCECCDGDLGLGCCGFLGDRCPPPRPVPSRPPVLPSAAAGYALGRPVPILSQNRSQRLDEK